MSDSRLGPARAESAASGPGSERTAPGTPPRNQAVLGPFTVRDLAVFGGVFVTFIGSLLPLVTRFQGGLYPTLWNAGGLYFLGVGILLPIALAGLFVWRRLAPETPIRIGSLSLDQFASVVALLSIAYFFLAAVTAGSVGGIVGFIGGAILVAATVFARFIPVLAGDFEGRAEVPAHIVARDAAAPAPSPAAKRAPRPAAPNQAAAAPASPSPQPQQASAPSAAGAPWAGSYQHDDEAAPGGSGTSGFGAGVTSASAAAAAAGFAGATAAGAGVASIAAGAMAAGEGATHEQGASEGAAPGESSQPAAAAKEPLGGVAEAAVEPEPAGLAAMASEGIAEATDEAGPGVIPGDADGEVYGAPEPVGLEPVGLEPVAPAPVAPEPVGLEPVAPAVEPDFGHTRMMPAASSSPGGEATAPTDLAQVSPAVDRSAGIEATQRDEEPEPAYEAFWFAVSEQRSAVDPHSGLPVFTLEPGQWILALQDRGSEFLVQSQDGRVGVLRDLSGIERG